jgi:hypothetical protein
LAGTIFYVRQTYSPDSFEGDYRARVAEERDYAAIGFLLMEARDKYLFSQYSKVRVKSRQ